MGLLDALQPGSARDVIPHGSAVDIRDNGPAPQTGPLQASRGVFSTKVVLGRRKRKDHANRIADLRDGVHGVAAFDRGIDQVLYGDPVHIFEDQASQVRPSGIESDAFAFTPCVAECSIDQVRFDDVFQDRAVVDPGGGASAREIDRHEFPFDKFRDGHRAWGTGARKEDAANDVHHFFAAQRLWAHGRSDPHGSSLAV